ncbi:MAG: ELWxxDGT repeat protein, partial [Bacteroidota bacterium]
DGTLTGTERVFQFKDHFPYNTFDMTGADLGNHFIFPAWTDETGFELWSMDKNNYQCNIIQDIHKTPGMGSNPVILHKHNNKVYFRATDSAHGRELWVTDGSKQGTKLVADMAPGTQSGRPDHIKAYGDYLSFYAFWPFDRDLWVINSSTDSLYTFEEIKHFGNRPEYYVRHRNNSILLIQGYDLEGNFVLWKSDWNKQNMKLLDNQCDFKPMHFIRSINYSDDVIYFTDTQNNLFKYKNDINCQPKARMEDFDVRPNPTSGSMQIIFTGKLPENAKVDIFDLSGRKISANKSENYMNIGWDLDLNNLKSGIYIARITLENQSHSLRFLKL